MNLLFRCGSLALGGTTLAIAACSSTTPNKDPGATYSLSAQAYADGVHVYARRDVLDGDSGVSPALSASVGDVAESMGPEATSPDFTAGFPVTTGAFTAKISGAKGTLATIDVPAAFSATPEQTVLHQGDHLKVTLSPAPGDGSKLTLRGMPGCFFELFDDITIKPTSADGAGAEFDIKSYFDTMLRSECDASFGVRYETTGHMGDGYYGSADGLREVTVTVHLVNPNAKVFDPPDAGVVADAAAD